MRGSNGVSEPLRGIGRQRAGDQRRLEHALDREQARQRLGGRELRAVEQREALLRRRARPARVRRARARRRPACARPSRPGLADADHRGRQMRERREIARGADRALARDHRNDVAREHRCRAGRPSPAARRRRRAPRLASFSAIISRTIAGAHRLADAGRVREHEVALQRRELVGGDAHVRELAEAGVDAVDRLALGDDRVDVAALASIAGIAAGSSWTPRRATMRAPVARAARGPA